MNGSHRSEPPPHFLGGILADPMGLGKSLTMIALILYNLERSFDEAEQGDIKNDFASSTLARPSLLVVPPSCKYHSIVLLNLH